MYVLIDGYNLLHAARAHVRGSCHLGRSQLCRLLGDWAEAESHRVVVVFDGSGPPGDLAEQLADPRIVVIQSGERDADTWLAEHLRGYSGAREALVVSSDHAVQRNARSRRAMVEDSEPFIGRLLRRGPTRPPGEPEEKREGLAHDERERWLNEFGLDAPDGFEHP